jgi:hypothetical protein
MHPINTPYNTPFENWLELSAALGNAQQMAGTERQMDVN